MVKGDPYCKPREAQMAKNKDTETPNGDGRRRTRVSQSDVPRHDLKEAVRVPRVLEEHYGGGPASPMDVAASLGSTPASSWFRTLTGAAIAYGLTEGGYNSADIKLTPLGSQIVAPTSEGDDAGGLREAPLKPRVMREFLTKYDRKKLPPATIARNVLASLGVDRAATERTYEVIIESARHSEALRSMRGDEWVDLRGAARTVSPGGREDLEVEPVEPDGSESEERPGGEGDDLATRRPALPTDESAKPKPIFVGHGKSKRSLGKVEEILKNFGIPYLKAVGEPNLGQPIPTKVKNVMKQCGSAILIFTKDEKFTDAEGNEIWRPSEN